jgi:hypothetical protein
VAAAVAAVVAAAVAAAAAATAAAAAQSSSSLLVLLDGIVLPLFIARCSFHRPTLAHLRAMVSCCLHLSAALFVFVHHPAIVDDSVSGRRPPAHLVAPLVLQGIVVAVIKASSSWLTPPQHQRQPTTPASSNAAVVIVIIVGGSGGLSASVKPWRRMACWSSSASSCRQRHPLSREDEGDSGSRQIAEEADVVSS